MRDHGVMILIVGLAIAGCGKTESDARKEHAEKRRAVETKEAGKLAEAAEKRAAELAAQITAAQKEITADQTAIDDAMKAVETATSQADRDRATASLAELRKTHAERVERLKVLEEQLRLEKLKQH